MNGRIKVQFMFVLIVAMTIFGLVIVLTQGCAGDCNPPTDEEPKPPWLTFPSEWSRWLAEHQKTCENCTPGLRLCDVAEAKRRELVPISDDRIMQLFEDHNDEMIDLWLAMGEEASVTDVVVEWVARRDKKQ